MTYVQPDFPEHWSHSFGCMVRSRRHFRELQKQHGVHDWEPGTKLEKPVHRPEWRTDLWTVHRLAREAGVAVQTAIDWREGRYVSSFAEYRLQEAERREFYSSVRNQDGLEDRLVSEGHRL
jgi:hypothetical protein